MTRTDRAPVDAIRYVRAQDLLWRRTSGAILLLPADEGEVFQLLGTGIELWAILAEPVTLDQAARALASQFGASPEVVVADISGVLADLVVRGAVVCDPEG